MISDFFLGLAETLAGWFFGFMIEATPAPPGWVTTGIGSVAEVLGQAGTLVYWVNLPLAGTVALFLIGANVAGLVIHFIRSILSLLTMGGGM